MQCNNVHDDVFMAYWCGRSQVYQKRERALLQHQAFKQRTKLSALRRKLQSSQPLPQVLVAGQLAHTKSQLAAARRKLERREVQQDKAVMEVKGVPGVWVLLWEDVCWGLDDRVMYDLAVGCDRSVVKETNTLKSKTCVSATHNLADRNLSNSPNYNNNQKNILTPNPQKPRGLHLVGWMVKWIGIVREGVQLSPLVV